jgi:glycosyltransferase involved in cell wall biosynthesis
VVHHAPFPLTDLAILIGLPAHIPLIVYWHADIIGLTRLKPFIAPIVNRVLSRADKILVSGTAMIESSDLLKLHASKCRVLPYGIDVNYWSTLDTAEAAAVTEVKRNNPRQVVSVGRLVPYKGFDVLIRAMRSVDARLTLIGEGNQKEQLSELVDQMGLTGRVRFSGSLTRQEIKTLLHSSDVFAFPSVTGAEAYGLAQAEAMAAGLPIVNTALPTVVPWVARHNQEALTVAPNDPEALAEALNAIIKTPDLAERLGAAASRRALNEFSQERYRTRMTAIYHEVLNDRAARILTT